MALRFEMEHVGGCNALCGGDRHFLIHDPADPASAKPLGDGWVTVGYVDEEAAAGPIRRPKP